MLNPGITELAYKSTESVLETNKNMWDMRVRVAEWTIMSVIHFFHSNKEIEHSSLKQPIFFFLYYQKMSRHQWSFYKLYIIVNKSFK